MARARCSAAALMIARKLERLRWIKMTVERRGGGDAEDGGGDGDGGGGGDGGSGGGGCSGDDQAP